VVIISCPSFNKDSQYNDYQENDKKKKPFFDLQLLITTLVCPSLIYSFDHPFGMPFFDLQRAYQRGEQKP
jgi:hypothetical protein